MVMPILRQILNRVWNIRSSQRRRVGSRAGKSSVPTAALENRVMLAGSPVAKPDLVASSIDAPTSMIAGRWYNSAASMTNQGAVLPMAFGATSTSLVRIEFRLSTDAKLDSSDLLIATTFQAFVAPNLLSKSWLQSVFIPSTVKQGTYYIGIVIDPQNQLAESNEANNSRMMFNKISIQISSIAGQVTAAGATKSVNLVNYSPTGQAISNKLTTWVVIHGRITPTNNAPTASLAGALDDYMTGDQVLILDWTQAAVSSANGGEGEAYITSVAAWAASTLKSLGFTGGQLNLVGHDMGAYVAAEMAKSFGKVNSIIAIDPAKDYANTTYNPEAAGKINFSANSNYSWAFFEAGGDTLGSTVTPLTATEQFAVTGSDHIGIVSVVTGLFRLGATHPIGQHFQLSRVLNRRANPLWKPNLYNFLGRRGAGVFEATIDTSYGTSIKSLNYVDASGRERTVF